MDWFQNSRKSCWQLRMGWGNHHKNQKENYRMPSYWFIIIIILFCVIHFIQSSWKVGEGMRSDHLTWRHTCVVLDFEEGLQWRLFMLSFTNIVSTLLYCCHISLQCKHISLQCKLCTTVTLIHVVIVLLPWCFPLSRSCCHVGKWEEIFWENGHRWLASNI